MNTPNLWTPEELEHHQSQAQIGKGWFKARTLGFSGLCLRKRLYFAWMVFTGKWDALQWYGQTEPVTRHPYSGKKRHPTDIEQDPHALGIVAPGAPLTATRSQS